MVTQCTVGKLPKSRGNPSVIYWHARTPYEAGVNRKAHQSSYCPTSLMGAYLHCDRYGVADLVQVLAGACPHPRRFTVSREPIRPYFIGDGCATVMQPRTLTKTEQLAADLDAAIRIMRKNPDHTDFYVSLIEAAGVRAELWPLEACDVYTGEE
jgi:hypothetical protein